MESYKESTRYWSPREERELVVSRALKGHGARNGPANPPLSWHPYAHGIRGSDANQSLAFMNATRGMFWLSHRPQSAWLALFRNWVKECHDEDQVRDVRRIVFGRR